MSALMLTESQERAEYWVNSLLYFVGRMEGCFCKMSRSLLYFVKKISFWLLR